MLSIDEIRTHSAAINASFPNIRAYAIRPYTCSLKFKHITTKYIVEKLPSHHSLAAINALFPNIRAYAIRPYTYSVDFN